MKHHILLIEVDQMNAACLSLLGHPDVRTPRLDGLARQGVLFRQALCNFLANSSYSAVLHREFYRNGTSFVAAIGINRGGGSMHARGVEASFTPAGHNVIRGDLFVDNCGDATRGRQGGADWGGRPELILPSERDGNEGNPSDDNVSHRIGSRGERMDRLLFGRDWNVRFAEGPDNWREKAGWDPLS